MKKLHLILLTVIAILSIPVSAFAEETINHTTLTSKTILVTFSVNMELGRLTGLFNPLTDTVSVGGNFNGWEKATMTVLQSNSNFYQTTVSVLTSVQDTIRFSFCYSPDIWEVVAIREYVVTQTDYDRGSALLDTIGFNSVSLADFPIEVDFRCNMSVQMKEGKFVRGDKVFVRGDFNGWSGIDFELKDVDGDSIYSRIFPNFKRDQSIAFKFVLNHAGNDIWETTDNRTLTVSIWGRNIYTVYWEDESVYKSTKTIQITFSVNVELQRLAGLFNPATDSVSVRGTFNDWQNTWMHPTPNNPDVCTTTVAVDAELGDTISFKFFITPITWEDDYSYPQLNRFIAVSQEIYDSSFVEYSTVFNNWFRPLANDCTVLFICNTNGAKIKEMPEGTPFKTLHLFGNNTPLKWPESGWPNSDSTLGVQMYDDGTHGDKIAGDNIFSNQITFQKYSTAIIKYKYSANWGLPENGGSNNNEGSEMNRILYIIKGVSNEALEDTFGITRSKYLTNVDSYEIPLPASYNLEQNYPNPFNPSTNIEYSVVGTQHVTLKVYDILGNEVATLVNDVRSSGNYKVPFNSMRNELSSGIYFYQLCAGDFVQTKKMILLR
ncbi:MAG: T9SS type A sorting domain-containing protein [Ignavibacteriaceae bacterium]|jgi:hypothetical protein